MGGEGEVRYRTPRGAYIAFVCFSATKLNSTFSSPRGGALEYARRRPTPCELFGSYSARSGWLPPVFTTTVIITSSLYPPSQPDSYTGRLLQRPGRSYVYGGDDAHDPSRHVCRPQIVLQPSPARGASPRIRIEGPKSVQLGHAGCEQRYLMRLQQMLLPCLALAAERARERGLARWKTRV